MIQKRELGGLSRDLHSERNRPEWHRPGVTSVRTLFISDVHLGTAACHAEPLLCFLRSYRADTIYLVGDIVDGWRLLKGRSLPRSHLAVITELLARSRAGVKVIYIPGNHDEYLRQFIGLTVGGVAIVDSAIHESAAGRRYLVLHGDQLDRVVQRVPWAALLGNLAYRASLAVNNVAPTQRRLGPYYRAASTMAKLRIRAVVNSVSRSEERLTAELRRIGVDGVVCGHTHDAADCDLAGMHYLNTGDWVESCTGVIERLDGCLSMVRWADREAAQGVGVQLVHLSGIRPAGDDIPAAA